jgi:hypothetical protein
MPGNKKRINYTKSTKGSGGASSVTSTTKKRKTNQQLPPTTTTTKTRSNAFTNQPPKTKKNILSEITKSTNIKDTININLRNASGHSTIVPHDLFHSGKYHECAKKLGRELLNCHRGMLKLLPNVETKDGKQLVYNPPSVAWNAMLRNDNNSSRTGKIKMIAFSLNYLTTTEAYALKELCCMTASKRDDALRCSCWELIRFLTSDGVYFGSNAMGTILLDACGVALPLDVPIEEYIIDPEDIRKIDDLYRPVLKAIFDVCDNIAFFAVTAQKTFSKALFGSSTKLSSIYEDKKHPRHSEIKQKVISRDEKQLKVGPHPCVVLHPRRWMYLDTNIKNMQDFATLVIRKSDNDAPAVNILDDFVNEHSDFFKFLQEYRQKSCILGGEEAARMLKKAKRIVEYLRKIYPDLTKEAAAAMIELEVKDESKEGKAQAIQSMYMSSLNTGSYRQMVSDTANQLVATHQYKSLYEAAMSTEMIDSLKKDGMTRKEAEKGVSIYIPLARSSLVSDTANQLVATHQYKSLYEAAMSTEMIDSLKKDGMTREEAEKAVSIYIPSAFCLLSEIYMGTSDNDEFTAAVIDRMGVTEEKAVSLTTGFLKSKQCKSEHEIDEEFTDHLKTMEKLWNDRSNRVMVEDGDSEKEVLYIPKKKEKKLNEYLLNNLFKLDDNDPKREQTKKYNFDLWDKAKDTLRNQRYNNK